MCRNLLVAPFLLLLTPPTIAAERVVLLNNGGVLTGQVTETESRVIVHQNGTRAVLAPREVDAVVKDLDAAYLYQAARVPSGNVVARERLLGWCIQKHLVERAQEQFRLLGQEHPELPRLTLWQRRIQSHDRLAGRTVLPSSIPQHPDRARAMAAEGSLSDATQAQFVRRIQPILLNRCAAGGCHGRGTESRYGLVKARAPLPRALSQRNLGATLRQLDGPAEQSLLWISAIERHGSAEKWPIRDAELETLFHWIQRAAQESLGTAKSPKTSKVAAVLGVQNANRDPFDPAQFNQMIQEK